jgi:hypothetical protein
MRLSLPSSLASKCAKEHRHGVPSLFATRVHGASVPCLAAVCRATVFVFSIPCLAAVCRATVFVFSIPCLAAVLRNGVRLLFQDTSRGIGPRERVSSHPPHDFRIFGSVPSRYPLVESDGTSSRHRVVPD